ncbi:hypothetical protein CRUP_026626 [Coryphaenoides rupestris]|nr:hypothetical protein CRUP_026626 [Coryphaenoides rupestris]
MRIASAQALTAFGVRPFPCPHCDKIFRTSGHRKTHIASHFKSLQQKKHKFPRKANKAKTAGSRLGLQQYLEMVGIDRPYKCVYCSKAYKKSSHLKQHVSGAVQVDRRRFPATRRSSVLNSACLVIDPGPEQNINLKKKKKKKKKKEKETERSESPKPPFSSPAVPAADQFKRDGRNPGERDFLIHILAIR